MIGPVPSGYKPCNYDSADKIVRLVSVDLTCNIIKYININFLSIKGLT